MNWRAAIPNALTLGNLACGVLALVILILDGGSSVIPGPGWHALEGMPSPFSWLPNERVVVIYLLVIAAILDLLDGWAARLLKVDGALGAQLDSLADLVSFGLVPALFLLKPISEESLLASLPMPGGYPSGNPLIANLALVGIVAYTLAAAFRLARFNVSQAPSIAFVGLPSPASGLLLLGLGATYMLASNPMANPTPWVALTTVALALAMVSRWPFLSFKGSMTHKLALVGVFVTGALVAWLSDWQPWSVLATLVLYAVVSRALIRPIATPTA